MDAGKVKRGLKYIPGPRRQPMQLAALLFVCLLLSALPFGGARIRTVMFCSNPHGGISDIPVLAVREQHHPKILHDMQAISLHMHNVNRTPLTDFGLKNTVLSEPLSKTNIFSLYSAISSTNPSKIVALEITSVPSVQYSFDSLLYPTCRERDSAVCGYLEDCKEGAGGSSSCVPLSHRSGSIYECGRVSSGAFRKAVSGGDTQFALSSAIVYDRKKRTYSIESVAKPSRAGESAASIPFLSVSVPISPKSEVGALDVKKIQMVLDLHKDMEDATFHVESSNSRGFAIFSFLFRASLMSSPTESKCTEVVSQLKSKFKLAAQQEGVESLLDADMDKLLNVLLKREGQHPTAAEERRLNAFKDQLDRSMSLQYASIGEEDSPTPEEERTASRRSRRRSRSLEPRDPPHEPRRYVHRDSRGTPFYDGPRRDSPRSSWNRDRHSRRRGGDYGPEETNEDQEHRSEASRESGDRYGRHRRSTRSSGRREKRREEPSDYIDDEDNAYKDRPGQGSRRSPYRRSDY